MPNGNKYPMLGENPYAMTMNVTVVSRKLQQLKCLTTAVQAHTTPKAHKAMLRVLISELVPLYGDFRSVSQELVLRLVTPHALQSSEGEVNRCPFKQ